MSLGLVQGCSRVASLGTNTAAAALASFWPGNAPYPWIPSARTLEIVSDNVGDAAAGVGARAILVQGLDANFNALSEVVALNGTTAVPLINTYMRLNGAICTSAGSSQTNVGNISIRDTGAGATRGIIPVAADGMGTGFLSQCAYTVPAGFTLLVQSIFLSINRSGAGSNNNVTSRIWLHNNTTGTTLRPLEFSTSSNQPYRHQSEGTYPVVSVGQKTDLDFTIAAASSGFNASAAFVGTLFNNASVLTP